MKHTPFFIIAVLVIAVSALSFFVPAYGPTCWYSFETILTKAPLYPFLHDGVGMMARFFSVFNNFHLNCDKGFIPLIADFPAYYMSEAPDAGVYLNRPLYPLLASLLFRAARPFIAVPDFILSFGAAFFINLFAVFCAATLMGILVRRWLGARAAWLAVMLFLFSPFVHVFINQPIAEMLSALIVVVTLYLLDRYARTPSRQKLILYSFLFGCLMLGKMIYALLFFVLFCAWYFKRFYEGFIFLIVQAIPLGVWFFIVRFVMHTSYYIHEVHFGDASGQWLTHFFENSWRVPAFIVLDSVPHFFTNTVYGFMLIPLVCAVYGYYAWQHPHKRAFVFGWIGSFFLLSFVMRFWQPRLSFLMFPIIYACAALGLLTIRNRYGALWMYGLFSLIVFFSSIMNVYDVIPYG